MTMDDPDAMAPDLSRAALSALCRTLPADGLRLPDVAALERFAARLAEALVAALAHAPVVVSLDGDLGAGKTTLARALLHVLGHSGPVKSPTYTLFETYRVAGHEVAHVDLYRVIDPQELELIGFDELVARTDLLLVEWASQGGRWMPEVDLAIRLETLDEGGRHLTLELPPIPSTL